MGHLIRCLVANPPAASRRRPRPRRRARRSEVFATPGHAACTKLISTTPRTKGRARGVWGGPEARRRQALAAAEPRVGGRAGCGAPFGLGLLANDAEEHGDDDGHKDGLVCLAGARLRRPWRRACSESMADPAGVSNPEERQRGFGRKLTLKLTGVVAGSGRRWSRRISSSIRDGRR